MKERISLFPEPVLEAARRNVAVFKRYRHLLQQDSYRLLDGDKDQPQAIQFVSTSGDESVVLVFKAESKEGAVQLPLRGLRKNTDYEITFANRNQILQVASNSLLSNGIAVALAQPDTSEVVLMRTRN